MTGCESFGGSALYCSQCICVTWASVIGLILPLAIACLYIPRVLQESTVDDWLIVTFTTIFTFASRKVSDVGIAHAPWMLYVTVMWACIGCATDRTASLRSLPLIWFLVFVSVLVPDLVSVQLDRPAWAVGIPGGGGIFDGLIVKPLLAVGVTWICYLSKTVAVLAPKRNKGKSYDADSRAFLLNISPR